MAQSPRLLYVTYSLPRVPASGGLTRAYHLVRAAAGIGPVTLLGVVEEGTAAPAQAIAPYCEHLHCAPAPLPPAPSGWTRPLRRLLRRLREALDPTPAILWRFDERPLRVMAERLLASDVYDLVIAEHLEIAAALLPTIRRWGGPALVDFHNILSAAQTQTAGPDETPNAREEGMAARLRQRERRVLRAYRGATAVSVPDARRLRALVPDATVKVVPNGVDLDYFSGDPQALPANDQTIFTGALWYRPNVDGLAFFADAIWPRIRQRRPAARFQIVGARPTEAVQALAARPGVTIHPSVADVRPYLEASAVAVVPLRLGSGTRLKILEALAAGRAVVSTTRGAEGLELTPGRDLWLADRPDDFADAVIELLGHPDQARRLAAQGQATVARRYGWSTIGETFQDVLGTLLPVHDLPELQLDR